MRSKKDYTLHQSLFFFSLERLQGLPQGIRGFTPLLQGLAMVLFSLGSKRVYTPGEIIKP
jgi:hypothetical protein